MLLELEIKNFILIDHHKIDFNKGLSCITGETGAGKSIILDALQLIKGIRVESRFQKNKDKKTEILASFNIEKNFNVINFLQDKDMVNDEDDSLLFIRRNILPNGKSSSYINNVKCTLQDLKLITSYLVEIYSQNSNKKILLPEEQRNILDIYSNNSSFLDSIKNLNNQYKKQLKELNIIKEKKKEENNKIELITYKLEELNNLNIQEGEYEELEDKFKMLNSADTLLNSYENSIELLNGSPNIIGNLHELSKNLEDLIENDNLKEIKKMLEESLINLEEVSVGLNDEKNKIYSDPQELLNITERLNLINSISKKHFVDPNNMSDYITELNNELEIFNDYDEKIIELENELKIIYEKWVSESKSLSKIRMENSNILSEEINNKIHLLKMENAQLKIEVKEENFEINPFGIDKIDFYLSSNLGSEFEPIKSAASGGELSRISLAIQSIISKNQNIPVRIFDEVDSGIGGTTGNSIGLFLYEIGKHSQVLNITHLAQVAAFADNNFYVHKKECQ